VRRHATGLVALAAGLALAGCTSSGTSGASGSSPGPTSPAAVVPSSSTDPAAATAIKSSTDAMDSTSYTFTVKTDGLTGSGANDPNTKTTTLTLSGQFQNATVKVDSIVLGAQAWMKIDLGNQNGVLSIPTKWMHVDTVKLGSGSGLDLDATTIDPANPEGLWDGLTGAAKVDSTHYTGTVDLTKVAGRTVSPYVVQQLGNKANAVPIAVTTDGQGRLTDLVLKLSTVDSSLADTDVSYGGYGSTVTATAPASADVVEAPDAVYNLFRNA
jgi:hypothetical protein